MNSDRTISPQSTKHLVWKNSLSLIKYLASCPVISKKQFAAYWQKAIETGNMQSHISLLKYLNIIRQTSLYQKKQIKQQDTQISSDVTKIKIHRMFINCLDMILSSQNYLKQFTNLMLEFSKMFFLAIYRSTDSTIKFYDCLDSLIINLLQMGEYSKIQVEAKIDSLSQLKSFLTRLFEIYYFQKDRHYCEDQWTQNQKNQFQKDISQQLKLITQNRKYFDFAEVFILLKNQMQIYMKDFNTISFTNSNQQNIFLNKNRYQQKQQEKTNFDKGKMALQIQKSLKMANSFSHCSTVSLTLISAIARVIRNYYIRYPQDYFMLLDSYYNYKFGNDDKDENVNNQQIDKGQKRNHMIQKAYYDFIQTIIDSINKLLQDNQNNSAQSASNFLIENDFIVILENTLLMLYNYRFYIIDNCRRVQVNKCQKQKRNINQNPFIHKKQSNIQSINKTNFRYNNQNQNKNEINNLNYNKKQNKSFNSQDSNEHQYIEILRNLTSQSQIQKVKHKKRLKEIHTQFQNKIFTQIKEIQKIKKKLAQLIVNIWQDNHQQTITKARILQNQMEQLQQIQKNIYKSNNQLVNRIKTQNYNKKNKISQNEQLSQIIQGQQTRIDDTHEFQLLTIQERKSKLQKQLKLNAKVQQAIKQKTVLNLIGQSYTNFYLRDYIVDIFVRQKYPQSFDVRQVVPKSRSEFQTDNNKFAQKKSTQLASIWTFFQLQQDKYQKMHIYVNFFYEKMLRRQEQQSISQPNNNYSNNRSNRAQSVYSSNLSDTRLNGNTRTTSSFNQNIFKDLTKQNERYDKYFPNPYSSQQNLKRLNFYHLQFLFKKSFIARFPLSEFKQTKQIIKSILIEYLQNNRQELYRYLAVLAKQQSNVNTQKKLPSIINFIHAHQSSCYQPSFDQLLVYLITDKLDKSDSKDCYAFFDELRNEHTKLFKIIILFYATQLIQNQKRDVQINFLRKANLKDPKHKTQKINKTNKSYRNGMNENNNYDESQQDIDIDGEQRQKRQPPSSFKSNIQANIKFYLQRYLTTEEFNQLLKFSIMKLKISTSYTLKLYGLFYQVVLDKSINSLEKLNKILKKNNISKRKPREQIRFTKQQEQQFVELFTSLKLTALLVSSFKCSIKYQYGSNIKNGLNSLLNNLFTGKNQRKYYKGFCEKYNQIPENSLLAYYCTACEELNLSDKVCVQPNRFKLFWCKYCHIGNLDRLEFSHESIKDHVPLILYNEYKMTKSNDSETKTQQQKANIQYQMTVPTQYPIQLIKYNLSYNTKRNLLIRLLSENRQLLLMIAGKIPYNPEKYNKRQQMYGQRGYSDRFQNDQLFQEIDDLDQQYQKVKHLYKHCSSKHFQQGLDKNKVFIHPQINDNLFNNTLYATIQYFNNIFNQI